MMKESYVGLVNESLETNWDLKAFSDYEGGTYSFAEVASHIHYLHQLYQKCGIKAGDKIAIYGRNSSNWAIAYLSVITYEAIVVPILPNFGPNEVHHLMNHSESCFVFASQSLWEALDASKMLTIMMSISLDDFSCLYATQDTFLDNVEEFNRIKSNLQDKTCINWQVPSNDKLLAIIYTSGTTGFSKGVMLTHNSITANIVFSRNHMLLKPGDRILSLLPLAHAYGCSIEFLYPFTLGCHITFLGKTPSPQVLVRAFSEVKPRLILSVPLILEKIYKTQVKATLSTPRMKIFLGIPFIENIVYKKVLQKLLDFFGDNFIELIIGGAALNEEVQIFLRKIRFPFTVGYGTTECGPLITYAPWYENRLNSCGRCVDTLEMKIDSADPQKEVGEILVKGENVMVGYYKNPEATRETFTNDGWLRTGDLGIMDSDGFLYIKGRIKSLIVGPSGQNIYPEEIESIINNWPYVTESLVVERKNQLVALIYPNMEEADKDKIGENQLSESYNKLREEMNKKIPAYMNVSRIEIYPHEFEKTPKNSIKRFLYS